MTSKTTSRLSDRAWAVIGDAYLNFGLTHEEAISEARDLAARKQHAVVVTRETAMRLVQSNVGLAVATMPELRF